MSNQGGVPAEEDFVGLLMASVPSILAYWDRSLICRYANAAYERWFGIEPRSLIGTSLHSLPGPELYGLNEPHISAVLAGREQHFERVIPGPNGILRHSLAHYLPHVVAGEVRGFMVLVNDVGSCKEVESRLREQVVDNTHQLERLRRSEEQLREAQRLGNIGSWDWEADADIVTWSEQLYRIFEMDPTRLPPAFADQARLFTPDSWKRLSAAVGRAFGTGFGYVIEVEYIALSGRGGWLEARGEVVRNASGDVAGLRGTALEISDRRRIEALARRVQDGDQAIAGLQLERQHNAELKRALAGAEHAQVLSLLTSGIAHDFNNLLAAIAGCLNVVDRVVADPLARDFIQRAFRGVDGATHLVRQMASLGGGDAAEVRVVPMAEALNGFQELLRVAAGASVELVLSVQANWHVKVDPRRLEFALLNLAINARDAMPRGGTLRISVIDAPTGMVVDGEALLADHVIIVAADDGVGMAPEVLAKARDPYFTTKPAGQGTGLGLMMVDEFVRQAGGSFGLTSRPGHGTSATILLPRAVGNAAPAAPSTLAARNDSMHGAARILLVDDDPLLRPVVARQLQELNYDVVEAASADEAWTVVVGGASVDVVLTDVGMPGRSGVALAAGLRALHPGLPVALMTGDLNQLDDQATEVLRKPFSPARLAHAVAAALGRLPRDVDRMMRKIHNEQLRALYVEWSQRRTARHLPSVIEMNLDGSGVQDHIFIAEITSLAPFRYTRLVLGSALRAALEGDPAYAVGNLDKAFALENLEEAYRRCVRRREASYEFLRLRLGDATQPLLFQRLLLPCTDENGLANRLVGMVLFENLHEKKT